MFWFDHRVPARNAKSTFILFTCWFNCRGCSSKQSIGQLCIQIIYFFQMFLICIYIEHSPFNVGNMYLHCCAVACASCATKQIFAQCRLFFGGTLVVTRICDVEFVAAMVESTSSSGKLCYAEGCGFHSPFSSWWRSTGLQQMAPNALVAWIPRWKSSWAVVVLESVQGVQNWGPIFILRVLRGPHFLFMSFQNFMRFSWWLYFYYMLMITQ